MKAKYRVIIDEKRCKGCLLCVMACPKNVLKKSDIFNEKGYHYAVIVNEDKCSGCNYCYIMCPDMSIGVEKEDD